MNGVCDYDAPVVKRTEKATAMFLLASLSQLLYEYYESISSFTYRLMVDDSGSRITGVLDSGISRARANAAATTTTRMKTCHV